MSKINKTLWLSFIFCLAFGLGVAAIAQEENGDTASPEAVEDLTASNATANSVELSWTAPGDENDSSISTSTVYDIRYATSTITEDNWDSSTTTEVANEPTPQDAGSSETMTVSGLEEEIAYYFALKSLDEDNNESALSNVVEVTTLASEEGEEEEEEEDVDDLKETDFSFEMKMTPQSLNLSSQGRWVTAHLFVPAPHSAGDVDVSSLVLNVNGEEIVADANFKGYNFFNKSNRQKERNSSNLVVKFSRAEVAEAAEGLSGETEMVLTGNIGESTFSASDSVYVLSSVSFEEEEEEEQEEEESNEEEDENGEEEILVSAEGEVEVYAINGNKRRHIPSARAFKQMNYKWENVKQVPKRKLDAYEEDNLLRASEDSAVYLIWAGMKRHIPSPEVFNSYGFSWDEISVVAQEDLENYQEANLIRAAGDSKVYKLAGGKRHLVPSVSVFNSKGYKWDNVAVVNSSEKEAIPEGDPVE